MPVADLSAIFKQKGITAAILHTHTQSFSWQL